MLTHANSRLVLVVMALILMLPASRAIAQLNSNDVDYLQREGEDEGWTFSVNQNSVTGRSIDKLCAVQEPDGWQAAGRANPDLAELPNGASTLPSSWDWRQRNGCTPIKNQAACGSCWAFATTGVFESSILINTGVIKDLSEQYLVSCNRSGWSCAGGWFAHDYHWNVAGAEGRIGAVLEASKPYKASNIACGAALTHPYVLKSWYYVDPAHAIPSNDDIKRAIMTYGPVSVCVYVNYAFQAYTGGVFNASEDRTINHAVILVGWNDSEQAWILRNSWGTGWGESGYMRIRYGCSRVGYGACYVTYGTGRAPGAEITTPAPTSAFGLSSVTFGWTTDSDATEYWLGIGTIANKANLYSQSQGTNTAVTVENLPVDGKPVYVKLFSKIAGQWYGKPANYTAANLAPAAAQMTSPANASTLDPTAIRFDWTVGTRVTEYNLWVGAAPGTYNLYNKSQGLNRSVTLNNLPVRGQPLYVRLMSKIAGKWQFNDYTYTAAPGDAVSAVMTSPANGSTLDSATVNFAWSAGTGVSEYMIHIGTTAGGKNLYAKSQGTSTSATIAGLPSNGTRLYVRLWSKCSGVWQYNDCIYTAANLVRGLAEMTSPSAGATFASNSVKFDWSEGVGVTEYRLSVGTVAGAADLYNKSQGLNRTVTVDTLPSDGRPVYVRLWSLLGGKWQQHDYTYKAVTITTVPADITKPAPGNTFSSSLVTFEWSAGTGVAEYWLCIGTKAGGVDLYNLSQGLNRSVTVAGLPINSAAVYVRLKSKISGVWQTKDYTYRATSTQSGVGLAQMISPAAGSTLTSAVTFQWSVGTAGAEYRLSIGTEPGGLDVYDQLAGRSAFLTVTGLPTNGSRLYARLWTQLTDGWQYQDYTYTAAGR